jgi:hypothetical protein
MAAPPSYRPHAAPGVYVPTTLPAFAQWPRRKPWLMTSAAQSRPAPPPSLQSERWARGYNEIKSLGGLRSTQRSAEQTAIARFWEATLPPIYHGVVRNVADQPGRDVMRNARLVAAVTQAMDDASIAVYCAKYHYAFWRPITAIRNGDLDDNDATDRDASWLPLIDTPMHPEYRCAHCIQAATIAAILRAETSGGPQPVLSATRPTPTVPPAVGRMSMRSCKRLPIPASTRACAFASPPKSASTWASESVRSPSSDSSLTERGSRWRPAAVMSGGRGQRPIQRLSHLLARIRLINRGAVR